MIMSSAATAWAADVPKKKCRNKTRPVILHQDAQQYDNIGQCLIHYWTQFIGKGYFNN